MGREENNKEKTPLYCVMILYQTNGGWRILNRVYDETMKETFP